MIKKEIYPKTQRVICEGAKIQITEKLEGFVVNYNNYITKYVRMKNGKLQEHFDRS